MDADVEYVICMSLAENYYQYKEMSLAYYIIRSVNIKRKFQDTGLTAEEEAYASAVIDVVANKKRLYCAISPREHDSIETKFLHQFANTGNLELDLELLELQKTYKRMKYSHETYERRRIEYVENMFKRFEQK